MTWRGLIVYSAAFAGIGFAYRVFGVEPSTPARLLLFLGPVIGVAVWIEADAKTRRRSLCWEFGTFVCLAWMVAVPTYCFWSRGKAGWPLLVALGAAVVAPAVLAAFLYSIYQTLGV